MSGGRRPQLNTQTPARPCNFSAFRPAPILLAVPWRTHAPASMAKPRLRTLIMPPICRVRLTAGATSRIPGSDGETGARFSFWRWRVTSGGLPHGTICPTWQSVSFVATSWQIPSHLQTVLVGQSGLAAAAGVRLVASLASRRCGWTVDQWSATPCQGEAGLNGAGAVSPDCVIDL